MILEQHVPKVLPHKEDIMQYYLEMLPDYLPTSQGDPSSPQREYEESKIDSPFKSTSGSQSASKNNSSATTAPTNSSKSLVAGTSTENASLSAPPKKTKEEKGKSASDKLEEASSIHRQKFLDSLNALQSAANATTTTTGSANSPTIQLQKTYKVKSETKQAPAAPQNPFIKPQPVARDDSPLMASVSETLLDQDSNYKPFEKLQPQKKPTIFDKVEKPGAFIQQQIDAANAQKIKIATAKIDKKPTRKKGKLVKGVTYTVTTSVVEEESKSESAAPIEESKIDTSQDAKKSQNEDLEEHDDNSNSNSLSASVSSLPELKSTVKQPVPVLSKTQSELPQKKKQKDEAKIQKAVNKASAKTGQASVIQLAASSKTPSTRSRQISMAESTSSNATYKSKQAANSSSKPASTAKPQDKVEASKAK